jgi:hypothetical protein
MSDLLRRLLRAGRKGTVPTAEDLDALEAALADVKAGTSMDKAFGLTRAKAGRPRRVRYQWRDVKRVMAVLDVMASGLSQAKAMEKVTGHESNETLRQDIERYGGFVRWALSNGYTLDAASLPRVRVMFYDWLDWLEPPPVEGPKPSAQDDFVDT